MRRWPARLNDLETAVAGDPALQERHRTKTSKHSGPSGLIRNDPAESSRHIAPDEPPRTISLEGKTSSPWALARRPIHPSPIWPASHVSRPVTLLAPWVSVLAEDSQALQVHARPVVDRDEDHEHALAGPAAGDRARPVQVHHELSNRPGIAALLGRIS
jgi:hypothetical protein